MAGFAYFIMCVQLIATGFMVGGYMTEEWISKTIDVSGGQEGDFVGGLFQACVTYPDDTEYCGDYDLDCDVVLNGQTIETNGEQCSEFNGVRFLAGLAIFFGALTVLTNFLGCLTQDRRLAYSSCEAFLMLACALGSVSVWVDYTEDCYDSKTCDFEYSFYLYMTGLIINAIGFVMQIVGICISKKNMTL